MVLIGGVACAVDLNMVPEAISKKLEPMPPGRHGRCANPPLTVSATTKGSSHGDRLHSTSASLAQQCKYETSRGKRLETTKIQSSSPTEQGGKSFLPDLPIYEPMASPTLHGVIIIQKQLYLLSHQHTRK